jgi:hypothetical protein
MVLTSLLALMVQTAAPAAQRDPLTQRMHQYCRSKPRCVARQQQSVRAFLDMITRQRLPQPVIQRCLAKAAKGRLTDWSAAESCLKRAISQRRQ